MKKKENLSYSKKALFAFSLTSFLNDFSSDIIASLLPFITKLLGGNERDITIIMGLRKGLSDFIAPIATYYSYIIKNEKAAVIYGYLIAALSRFLLLLSIVFYPSLIFVYITTTIDRIAKATRDPIRDKLISKVAKNKQGQFFSFHRAADTLGAFLGSLLAALLSFLGVIPLLLISSVSGLISFIPLKIIKGNNIKRKDAKLLITKEHFISYLTFLHLNIGLPIGVFAKTLYESIIFYVIYNISYILSSFIAGFIGDKSRFLSFYLSIIFSLMAFLSFFYSSYYLGFVFMGLASSFFEGNAKAYVLEKNKNTGSISMLYFLSGLASLLSSFIASYLISQITINNFFMYWSFLHITGFIVLLMLK
jgi:MFS family permease